MLAAALALSLQLHAAPAVAASQLAGTVYESSGMPAISALVEVVCGTRRWRFLTGDDGRYYVGNLPDGTCRIAIVRAGRTVYSAEVSLPRRQALEIRLP